MCCSFTSHWTLVCTISAGTIEAVAASTFAYYIVRQTYVPYESTYYLLDLSCGYLTKGYRFVTVVQLSKPWDRWKRYDGVNQTGGSGREECLAIASLRERTLGYCRVICTWLQTAKTAWSPNPACIVKRAMLLLLLPLLFSSVIEAIVPVAAASVLSLVYSGCCCCLCCCCCSVTDVDTHKHTETICVDSKERNCVAEANK